jgi:hypothetical protein
MPREQTNRADLKDAEMGLMYRSDALARSQPIAVSRTTSTQEWNALSAHRN